MAETLSGETRKNKSCRTFRPAKLSTRVDLTPMVDLGFLLITFFIFTTAMSQPSIMKLSMPNDHGEPTAVIESGALTVLTGFNSEMYYYEGKLETAALKKIDLVDLRTILIRKKRSTPADDLFVIIKPLKNASYGEIINLLDELTINTIDRYTIVDITIEEEAMIQ